ncbi:MAG: E3 binding domain-containing protein, partial [Chloroflexota bacterium]|nr:E3 binding domain-containing protein [Chloroflexota bacterium]
MYEFKLADLGEGMHEAEVVEWLIKVGDVTKLDQTIARVETDKAIVELPAPVTGRVQEIRVQDGQTAKVGDVLVLFETATSPKKENPAKNDGTATPIPVTTSSVPSSTNQPTQPSSGKRSRVLAAPAVRKLAFERGVELENVTPSANGRVTLEDVRAYAEQTRKAPASTEQAVSTKEQGVTQKVEAPFTPSVAPDERHPLTGLRKRIAEHMERSWRTIPHATAFDEVDGTQLIAL